ncbi:hypothetical protein [Promicromonospora soli]
MRGRDLDDLVEAVQGSSQVIDLGLDAVTLGAEHSAAMARALAIVFLRRTF